MLSSFKKYIQDKTKITDEQFDRIAKDILSKKIKKDTILLREGDVCSQVFFVSKGLLRAYTIDSLGKEHIIQFGPEDARLTFLSLQNILMNKINLMLMKQFKNQQKEC